MSYENVKLWFAKDEEGNIVTIDNINELNKKNVYNCPVCGSSLNPKAIESKRITPHFAHIDASKCNSESQIHFWLKHKFIEKGDEFTIVSDKERNYSVKDILVEQSYDVEDKKYKPDVTILTECGNTIYFEMAFTNKKKVKDYLDIWLELKNIVVEVDIKQLMINGKTPIFKALFYNGKCFNVKRNDMYYNTIGKYKEEKLKGRLENKVKERIRKLDWFWSDVLRYKKGEVNAEYLIEVVKHIEIEEKFIVYDIVKRIKCSDVKSVREYLRDEIKKYNTTHRFYNSLRGKDSPINVAVSKLNVFFKNIDSDYKVVLCSNTARRKAYRYTRYRKIGYWKVEYYYYNIELRHKLSDYSYLYSKYITTYIKELNDSELIFNCLYEEMKDHSMTVKCKECNEKFKLKHEEIVFYKKKGLHLPKRCESCRNKRRLNKNKEE